MSDTFLLNASFDFHVTLTKFQTKFAERSGQWPQSAVMPY